MEKGKQILRDLFKASAVGFAAALTLGIVLLAVGGLAGGGLYAGLEAAKDGLLLLGALGIFLLAGMLLAKGKKPEKFGKDNGWKRHFQVLGIKMVLGVLCICFLLVASAADYLLLIRSI